VKCLKEVGWYIRNIFQPRRGGGAGGSLEGAEPPLLEVGYNFENSPPTFFVQNILQSPFWSHNRNYSIMKLVEG